MNAERAILILLLLASLALNIQQKFTAQHLVLANDVLIKEAQQPHPVHNAELTAWIGKDKRLTVIVNGFFVHKFDVTCFEGSQGKT
jgi:hypothetical protein